MPSSMTLSPPQLANATGKQGNLRRARKLSRSWRAWVLLLPLGLLFLAGFLLPLITVFRFAFDRFDADTGVQVPAWSLEQLTTVLTNPLYIELIIRTLLLAAVTTAVAALLAYPLAHVINRGPRSLRAVLMAMVLMPMMVSVVVKTFGWQVLLSANGVIQGAIDSLGVPIQLLFSPPGVIIGLVHTYMPFMAMSVIASYATINPQLEEAARSLGSSTIGAFFRVTFPQTVPGLLAGAVLTFVTSMSALVTPQMLGGGKVSTIVTTIYDQAMISQNWPIASALGIVLMMLTGIILTIQVVFRRDR